MNTFSDFLHKMKRMDTSEKTTLYCRDITVKLFKDYIKWRQERGNTNETINKALTPIIKAVKIIIGGTGLTETPVMKFVIYTFQQMQRCWELTPPHIT